MTASRHHAPLPRARGRDRAVESAAADSCDDHKHRLAAIIHEQLHAANARIATGEVLFDEGHPIESITLVQSGLVALRPREHGGILLLAGPGEFIGEPHGIADGPAPFAAVAVRTARVLTIPIGQFWRLHAASGAFAHEWAAYESCRTTEYQRRLLDLLAGDITAQVASLLLHQSAAAKGAQLTQQMIADLLGVQRSSVNHVVRRLERHDLIEIGYGYVQVRDSRRLASVAHGLSASAPAGAR